MTRKTMMTKNWISWSLILALGFSIAACSSPEQKAQAHYQSGQQLLQDGDYVRAGLEFRNALKYNDKLAEAWFALAAVEEKNLNWPAVAETLKTGVQLDPTNVEGLVKLAKLQLAAIQLDEALKTVNKANDLKKDDSDVLALRAAILLRLGDRDGARSDAERALAANPDNPDALAVLAVDQMVDQNMVAALRFIDRGLLADANNLGLLMFKLKIYADAKNTVQLEAVLRQIVAAYPAIKELRQALLNLMLSQNRSADVEVEMRAIVAAEPDNTAIALEFVSLINRSHGGAEARKELAKLIADRPDKIDYKLALAQLDFSEKKTDDALAALEALIAKGEPKSDVARAQLFLATMKIQLNQADEAKALIASVLEADAKNADALTLRANLSLKAGNVDAAVADLREALNQEPNAIPLLVMLARAHERQGTVDLANTRFTEALKASNFNPQISLDYIAFLERRGKRDQVEQVLNDAVARNPSDLRLLTALARLRLNKQDWVGAQAAADAIKKLDATSDIAQQIAGGILLGEKKFDESIEVLKDAFAATPLATEKARTLVMAYIQAGKVDEAEAFMQSILTASPNNADALVMMGAIKQLQKKDQEAEASFNMAIERQPGNASAYVALSRLYYAQGKPAEAEDAIRRGRDKAPADLSINLALAGLLEEKNDVEGAIKIYEELLKAAPDALIVINNLASLLADYRSDTESLDRALQLSRRLQSLDVPQFKDTVGWVAYRTGDYRTALTQLEDAASKLPNLALIKYHLAMTYAALKRNDDARAQFAKAEALLTGDDPLKVKITAALAALPPGNSGG